MNSIIYIICGVCYTIFGIQFLLSLFGYDFDCDIDLDFDGTPDISFSDLVSFKGILHFLMGGSTYLSIALHAGSLIWIDWLVAVFFGVVFSITLYTVCKLILFLQKEKKREEDISDREVIIIRGSNGKYVGQAEINGALEDFDVLSDSNLEVGKAYKILKFINNKIYI